jgi:hypothetical protein
MIDMRARSARHVIPRERAQRGDRGICFHADGAARSTMIAT